MIAALLIFAALAIAFVGWSALRMSALQEAAEAQRELINLLAEQAQQKDDDDIRNNIGV